MAPYLLLHAAGYSSYPHPLNAWELAHSPPGNLDQAFAIRDRVVALQLQLIGAAHARGLPCDSVGNAAYATMAWLTTKGMEPDEAGKLEVAAAIERLNQPDPPSPPAPAAFVSPDDLVLQCPEFAEKSPNARRQWLSRFRETNPLDFEPLEDADGSRPKFIYRLAAVQAALRNGNAK